MTLNNKSHLSSSFESLRLVSTLLLIALLTVLSGCSDSGYGEGTLDQEAKDYFKPVSVSVGHDHTCALLKSGIIKCWGKSEYGQIGNISADFSQITPITVSNISTAISSDSVCNYNCAVLSDGTIKCWGEGTNGQLGNGSNDNQTTPVNVSGITTATSVSAGGCSHTCALLSDGTIKCWGEGTNGKLGNGSNDNQTTPVNVSGITTATSVSSGYKHNCALLSDGTVKCWGDGEYGALGNGSNDSQTTPVNVSGITTATSVSSTCAVLFDGKLKCWGWGGYGLLGIGGLYTSNIPIEVSGIRNAIESSDPSLHNCAVLSDGNIKCWGQGQWGKLGNGFTSDQYAPVTVLGLVD